MAHGERAEQHSRRLEEFERRGTPPGWIFCKNWFGKLMIRRRFRREGRRLELEEEARWKK